MRKKGEIPSIKGQVIHFPRSHDLSDRRVLGLKGGRRASHFYGLSKLTRLQGEVNHHLLLDINSHVLLLGFAEPLIFGSHRIGPDPHRSEDVRPIGAGFHGSGNPCSSVGQCHRGTGYDSSTLILDGTQYRPGIDLAEKAGGRQDEKAGGNRG